jgi:hypothetical protein
VGAQVKIPLERYKFVKNPLAQRFDLKNQQGIHVSDVAIRNHLFPGCGGVHAWWCVFNLGTQCLQEGGKIVLVLEWVYDEEMGKKGALKHLAGIGKQLKHIKHKVRAWAM